MGFKKLINKSNYFGIYHKDYNVQHKPDYILDTCSDLCSYAFLHKTPPFFIIVLKNILNEALRIT